MSDKIRGAIPVQLTENQVELRDGSDAHPILLPNLKRITTEGVPRIVIMLADGQLAYWDISAFAGEKRLVTENGLAKFVDDYSSDLFSGEICEAECDGVDAALGVRVITHTCPGKPAKTMYQMVRIPKCCCDLEDLDCGDCETSLGFPVPP
jgi:hypothetical protein